MKVNRSVTLRNVKKFGGQRGCCCLTETMQPPFVSPPPLESLRYPILDESSNTISSRRGNLIK